MPFQWDSESINRLYQLLILKCDVKPGKAIWEEVADTLGGGLNGNAVRYASVDFTFFSSS